jgi:uroporphyrinogen-III synthase
MDLNGKRVLISRPRARAEECARALRDAGAQPVFFPVIEIAPPDDYVALDGALRNLAQYDWLIVTSVHAVDAFASRLQAVGVERLPRDLRVAAIGPRTARRLSELGLRSDHIPAKYNADGILPGLGGLAGRRFLLPQSDLARHTIAGAIRARGGLADEIVAYHTVPAHPDPSDMEALRAGLDLVTFASPSSVRNFVAMVSAAGLDAARLPGKPLIACLGPHTASAVKKAGLPVDIEAQEHTLAGLVVALKQA